jgi:ribose transport system substrate-binding protein
MENAQNAAKALSRRKFLQYSAMGVGAAGLASLAGCQEAPSPSSAPKADTSSAPAKAAVQTDETYVWLGAVTAIAFWLDGQQGFHAAGKSLGVKTEFLGPVEYDAVAQLKILEELIARKPAGIMIFPADDRSLNEPLMRAMKADIPVVVVNHDVDDPAARYGFVGPNNREVGRTGGKIAARLLNGKGKVAFMTTTNPAHGTRVAGYKDILSQYPDIKITAEVDEKSDPAYGLIVGTQLIQSQPDLDMIIGIDATAGAATARALKETGRAGQIKVVAMDRDDDMLPYVKDGTIYATLAQNSVMEEWVATHYLYWLKHNSIPAFKDWRAANAPQCPWTTDTGVTVVTRDNVDFFFH